MIRVVLLGRTGNNLFQYALGRALAEKHAVPLVLDASWYNNEGWKEVSHFLSLPIRAKVVRPLSLLNRAFRNATGGKHRWEHLPVPVLRESASDQSFDSNFLQSPRNCVLFGYFQTPLYFQEIENLLRTELQSLLGISKSNPPETEPIVAVHVRRGDYLKHPIFCVCDMAYYQSAMNEMRRRVPGARFHVYSDDPAWCQSAFSDADTRVIDSGAAGADPLHDLRAMASACHHIIANSSYSWWAAWLGKTDHQQVIMPDRWYAHSISAPIEEKQCPGWLIVPTGNPYHPA